MGPDVAVFLVIGIVGVVLSAFALFQTQRAKAADHRARLIDRANSRLEAFEGVSGSEDMARIQEYKMNRIREPGHYYAHFRQNSPLDIEVARSRLAKFWKVTVHLYEQKAVPDGFSTGVNGCGGAIATDSWWSLSMLPDTTGTAFSRRATSSIIRLTIALSSTVFCRENGKMSNAKTR